MPFDTGLLFSVAHVTGGAGRVLFTQTEACPVTFSGGATIDWSINGAALTDGAGVAVGLPLVAAQSIFDLSPSGTANQGTVALDVPALSALPAALRNNVINAIVSGGRVVLQVGNDGPSDEPLTVHLRALKTSNFLMNDNVAQAAHHSGVAAPNLTLPTAGDAIGNYALEVAENFPPSASDYSATATAVAANTFTLPAGGSAPPDTASRNLLLRITHSVFGKSSILPVDIHVPTDVILLFDRSGSMGTINPATGASKWNAAYQVGNLFAQLYGTMLPDLSVPNGNVVTANQIAFGRFWWSGGEQVPLTAFAPASPPAAAPADTPGGATPIGMALEDAADHFTANNWRRRHVLLLTDGMDNVGVPRLEDLTPAQFPPPSTAGTGVVLHNVSYALAGETPAVDLASLASAHDGQYHNSAPDPDPLSSAGLKDMFLNVLADLLPVERAATPSTTIPVESGVERVIFIADAEFPAAGTLQLSNGASATDDAQAGQANGFCWTVADLPAPGLWSVTSAPPGASVFALYDLTLRMRVGAEPGGLGQSIKLWADIRYAGRPVSGADVRVATSAPSESMGELLTRFAQSGGIAKSLARGYLDKSALAAAIAVPRPVRATADRTSNLAAAAVRANVDQKSLQRQLLEAAEANRNFPFQYTRGSITLQEVAPGRYEATVPPEATQEEDVRNFYFRADGSTPDGHAFARDRRLSVVLAATPDPETSSTSLVRTDSGNAVAWQATVTPRNAVGKPLGPGLGQRLQFQYVSPDDRKKLPSLATIDHLDGTYGTTLRLDDPKKVPDVALVDVSAPDRSIVVRPEGKGLCRVKVTLDKIQVLDDKDGCFSGPGELAFDAVVAPNASPSRTVRTRIPDKGVLRLKDGQIEKLDVVLYEGWVEADASLAIALGGTEFDWLSCFTREEKLARYRRCLPLKKGKTAMTPDDEGADPESLSDWRLWYTVQIE